MELYTLTDDFFPDERIDQFSSLIWTERFSSAGDVQLVVQPLPSVIDALAPGTLLGLRGQSEIMEVKTHSIENGLLTVTGSSLVKFLNERMAWFPNPAYDGSDPTIAPFADYTEVQKAGHLISEVVNNMVISSAGFVPPYDQINLDWALDAIPNLYLGHVDENGETKQLTFPIGQLYDNITQLASAEQVGFKLYLESATYSTRSYVLKFATYRGKDRTSEQTTNLMVRFSPQLDSLNGVKELTSSEDYKTVMYVTYKGVVTEHYPSYLTTPPTGFARRVLRVDAPDIYLDPSHIAAFREQVAQNNFAHHYFIKAVDGQVSSHVDYVFGKDYYLGDIIELEGSSGLISKARVTEYIRSQDDTGEQEYPTLAVLDPLDTAYVADLEPGPYVPEWLTDPSFMDDWLPADIGNVNPILNPVKRHRVRPISLSNPSNPLNPYDFNPEPVPNFTPTGGNGGNGGDGGIPAGDVGLTPLTPFEVTDWLYDTDVGYYVHQGTMYVIGEATADGESYFGSTDLLVNIPSSIAPTAPVSSKVLVDMGNSSFEYAYDSGLHIGPWLNVTIHPSGSVTLDDGNPFRDPGPNDSSKLVLVLSSLSWPTANVASDVNPETEAINDYLPPSGDAWTSIDSTFYVHNGRFHLDGKLKALAHPNNYDPLVDLPSAYQPKLSAESQPYHWCEVPQKDGYRFYIYTPDVGTSGFSPLVSVGSQKPQSAGNNGCGMLKHYFYSRNSDGFLPRGSSSSLAFTPGAPDAGLAFVGCSGTPIDAGGVDGGFPPAVSWRGSSFSASVSFKLGDLVIATQPTPGGPMDFSGVSGSGQLCFIIGLTPGLSSSYYKVVYIYDEYYTGVKGIVARVFLVTSGGGQIELAEANAHAFQAGDTYYASWQLDISDTPGDVSYPYSADGGNYLRFQTFAATPTTVFARNDIVSSSDPEWGGKGDMGFHLPGTAHISGANVSGIGDFPMFVPNDVIDFTGCGWPLT